jgi:hypothetical protein
MGGRLTKAQARALQDEARALGFSTGVGQICRGQWYLSVRHRQVPHWGFTVLSREEWNRKLAEEKRRR